MKCPYCGVHYLGGERQCPVCGKRAGIGTPKKKSKFTSQPLSYQPPKKTKSKAQNTYVSFDASAKKEKAAKKSNVIPIFLGIIIFLFAVSFLISIVVSISEYVSYETSIPEYESVYESCELYEVLPSGTWINDDGSMLFITYSDGSISWTDGTETATDSYPMMDRVNLTEETAPDYCSEEELQNYPVTEYTHYDLWFYDSSTTLPEYDLCVYLPNDTAPEDITAFDCYDRNTDTYFTLKMIDENELPVIPDTLAA